MASHSQLLLAFVSAVYFVACVNCFYWPQVPVAGGWHDINVKSENIQELVKEIPYIVPGFADLEIVKVVRARYQVVSGFKYALTIQTRPKSSAGPATQECTLTFWVQPWLRRRVLLGINCHTIKQNPQPPLLGGWREGEIDEAVRHAADFGMSEINRRCNCYYMKLIYKINSVHKQHKVCDITVLSQRWKPIGLKLVEHNCH